MLLDVNALEALIAAPPLGRDMALLVPLLRGGTTAFLNILEVI